jgi:hypothetical protein
MLMMMSTGRIVAMVWAMLPTRVLVICVVVVVVVVLVVSSIVVVRIGRPGRVTRMVGFEPVASSVA